MLKKLIHSIPLNRLTFYLLALGFLPLLYIPFDYASKSKKLQQMEEFLDEVTQTARAKEQKQEINTCVKSSFAKADPSYLEHQLEGLCFLQNEKEALEKIMKKGSFPGGPAVEQRYHFLTAGDNRLRFEANALAAKEKIEQSVESLAHPVEIDGGDLKKILSLIEEKQAGQPQLILTDFKLHKKNTANNNEVYELDLQILKREFPS